jgi:hypothetical protein
MSKSICIGLVILAVIGCNGVENTRIETAPPHDPNAPIYSLMWPTTPEWKAKFGESERSRIISNVSGLSKVVVELVQMANRQGERIKILEAAARIEGIDIPVTPDPNEVEK